MDNKNYARLQLIFTMLLFGTIGTLSRYINMPSSIICLGRAFFGVITIPILLTARKEKPDREAIMRNKWWLLLSSTLMCCNWICQFILAGAVVLKEKLTAKKLLCVAAAFCGMILVSGVLQTGLHISEIKGVIFGVSGGFFYAMVVLINKYMKDISPVNTTIMQMALVSLIMLPYSAATGAFGAISITTTGIICLLVLGVLHTGIGYIIYFDAVNKLPTQTVGILSYIDPVEAVLLSAFFLKEPINIYTIIGAVMILGAAAVSELTDDKKPA